uniref:Uncharacterized protein n=1 Tax=Solanum tuberosum TaxID=4113 RepID=M1DDK1_SOLTU
MDKTGVHSPTNVERAIVPAKGTASPGQTVTGKDSSNPLTADTLPKSKKTKETIQEKTIREHPNPEPTNSEPEDTRSRSDENDPSTDHFTQHFDPNDDDDSGMSFDSEALHNLDT